MVARTRPGLNDTRALIVLWGGQVQQPLTGPFCSKKKRIFGRFLTPDGAKIPRQNGPKVDL